MPRCDDQLAVLFFVSANWCEHSLTHTHTRGVCQGRSARRFRVTGSGRAREFFGRARGQEAMVACAPEPVQGEISCQVRPEIDLAGFLSALSASVDTFTRCDLQG